jgi:hypothetical protein
MKIYVVGYQQRKVDEPLRDPLRPWENVDVQFSPDRGDWLMGSEYEALRELELLNSMRVHVNEHACQFEIEEEDGTFAIICRTHPGRGMAGEPQ